MSTLLGICFSKEVQIDGSVLTGRSVHNVRVERLHLNVRSGVLCHYALLFTFMEEEGLLNADSEEHLLALQEVFIPRINRSFNEFVNQWNSIQLAVLDIRAQSRCLLLVR
jgi:hypothetical protein